MMEQTGSVFLECEKGYFHCSLFSDILIRNSNLDLYNTKEAGLIQTLSLLPVSYPGQYINWGYRNNSWNNNCKCGKLGVFFCFR